MEEKILKVDTRSKVGEMDIDNMRPKLNAWSDNGYNEEETSMKRMLRPMLYALALAGSYNFSDIHKKQNSSVTPSLMKGVLSNFYRIFFGIAIFLFMAKGFAAFFYLPKEAFLFNGLVIVWLSLLLTTYFIFLKATSLRFGHLEKVFQFWEERIMAEFRELGIQYPASSVKIYVIVALITGVVLVIFNITGIGIQMYFTGSGDFYTVPFPSVPYVLVFFFSLQLIASLVWIIPVAFIIVLTKLIKEAFKALNAFGSSQCKMNGCKMPTNFYKVRLLHLDLCKLVSDLDEDLSWFYGLGSVFSIGLGMFTIYQIMRSEMSTFQLVLFLFWFFTALVYLLLPATYAAFLQSEAHAPLETIYYINVQDITVEKLAQLNLFLSKLTGTQVGFSTCGLLIITKEFILTIAGVFLTYFAVLYTL